jgi:hypothetical protein
MYVLRIEHAVSDYEEWKKVFDSDPLGREKSGVVRYRLMRGTEDPKLVMIDLEFNTAEEAKELQGALGEVWARVDVILDPQALTAVMVETGEY